MEFSDYIVYVDESGDHGLATIDPAYPVFVLAFCIFKKEIYYQQCVPALQRLKFKHFGHDMVVLHEHEIRKAKREFVFLMNPRRRRVFMSDLAALVAASEFTLVASAINKNLLESQYVYPHSPYDLAVASCMERLQYFLKEHENHGKTVHVVFESRGAREDNELELEFRRVAGGKSLAGETLPFEPLFASKKVNCCGLQLADLIARPIGRHIINPAQENKAYTIIEKKFRQRDGRVKGYGLKIFP